MIFLHVVYVTMGVFRRDSEQASRILREMSDLFMSNMLFTHCEARDYHKHRLLHLINLYWRLSRFLCSMMHVTISQNN